MNAHVIVGGQFGSEAKGHVTAQIIQHLRNTDSLASFANVRVGGPNAGHSVIDDNGQLFALRTIPVGAVIPRVALVLAAGSEIEIEVLEAEIDMLESAGHRVRDRLYIDSQATILTQSHKDTEAERNLQDRLGSTAKGIGAARAARLLREAMIVDHAQTVVAQYGYVTNTAVLLRDFDQVVIEGTQGYGLGLHAGYYPYCTSGDCRSIDFLAQAGVHVSHPTTWVVYRTWPIRVAGNSGPMFGEVDWEYLAKISDGYIQPERTTVTKKIRRIGQWDDTLARAAHMANGGGTSSPVHPVLTFVDYLDPSLAGCTDMAQLKASPAWTWIQTVEYTHGFRFELFTTGPDTCIWRDSAMAPLLTPAGVL